MDSALYRFVTYSFTRLPWSAASRGWLTASHACSTKRRLSGEGGPDRPLRPNCRIVARTGIRAFAAEGDWHPP